jgi:hypothetical protein
MNGLSTISSLQREPMYIHKPHISASAAEPNFWRFKEQAVFKFENKNQQFNIK